MTDYLTQVDIDEMFGRITHADAARARAAIVPHDGTTAADPAGDSHETPTVEATP